jgi:hypothetical protein
MLFLHPLNLIKKNRDICIMMNKEIAKKEMRALNVGISLDIITKMATDVRYGHNIVDLKILILELLLGYHTYGVDRYRDDGVNDQRTYIYDIVFIIIITIISNKNNIVNALPFEVLIYSTRFYKELKPYLGIYKAVYVSTLWCVSIIILPSVLNDGNFNILQQPLDYMPYMFLMISTSNKADEKDIDEDKKNNIQTIPVKYGLEVSKYISNGCMLLFLVLLSINIYEHMF